MNLQERILGAFEPNESLSWGALHSRLGDVEKMALDVGLGALVRDKKLSLHASRYTVGAVSALIPVASIPTAAEEAAASLQPKLPTLVCDDCKDEKPAFEFRLLPNEKRAKRCNSCHGKRVAARQRKHRGKKAQAAAAVIEAPVVSTQPVIADRVFEEAQAQRQRALNRIECLQVEMANEQARVKRCDEFLSLYAEFSQEKAT